MYEGDSYGLIARQRWFSAGVSVDLPSQPKLDSSYAIQAGFFGHHYSKYLSHTTYIALNSALLDEPSACFHKYHADLVRKYLEIRSEVSNRDKVWRKCDPGAEIDPVLPIGGSGTGFSQTNPILLGPQHSSAILIHGITTPRQKTFQE